MRLAETGGKRALDMIDLDDPDPDQAIRAAMVQILPRLHRFCLALTASPADADDLCQSTLERAMTKLDRWMPGTRLDSWLYRMAQNLHKNTVRDRTNRLRLLDERASDLDGEQETPPMDLEASEVRRHVLALPEAQRQVLILISVEGYSYKECAAFLDLPPSTVTSRLFKARMQIRQAMESDAEENATRRWSASA